jgi:hypothetical protein
MPKLFCGEERLLIVTKDDTKLNLDSFKRIGSLLQLPFSPYFMTKFLCCILTSKEIFEMIDQVCSENGSDWDSNKIFLEEPKEKSPL